MALNRPLVRRFASLLLLTSLMLTSLGIAEAQDSQLEASDYHFGSGGSPGGLTVPEPARCYVDDIGGGISGISFLRRDLPLVFTGNPGEHVYVEHRLYQRLANGSFQYIKSSESTGRSIGDSGTASITTTTSFTNLPLGPDYVLAYYAHWYEIDLSSIGWTVWGNSSYTRFLYGVADPPNTTLCDAPFAPASTINAASGTVNSSVSYTLSRYPLNVQVPITWDGKVIGTATTNGNAQAVGSFKIPAAPMGPHTIRWNYGHWQASRVFTVKPRIKVIPDLASRDQTVNVSLRGYKARETVRIRWIKGSSWVEIARVTTSGTGSANIDIKVPRWVPDGATSVRGDSVNSTGGRAQTNAVTINGGPFSASSNQTPTATPTNTPEVMTSPTVTATASPEVTVSVQPTSPGASPETSPSVAPTEALVDVTPSLELSVTPTPVQASSSEPTAYPEAPPEAREA